MKEQNEENNLEVSGFLAKSEQYIEKNKKALIIVASAIVVIGLGIWAYIGLVANPRQVRAAEDMFPAEQHLNEGNYELALNGNDNHLGFLDIIDQYGCTKSGNLAKYYAGVCELNLGKYDEAIGHLKSYKGRDIFTGAMALMMIGDAYCEMEDFSQAVNYYGKAVNASDDAVVTPAALWKQGMTFLSMGEKEQAKSCFEQIKQNYPQSIEYNEADKYIGLCGE